MQKHKPKGRWESLVTEFRALLLQETSWKSIQFKLHLKINWDYSNNCLGCITFFLLSEQNLLSNEIEILLKLIVKIHLCLI